MLGVFGPAVAAVVMGSLNLTSVVSTLIIVSLTAALFFLVLTKGSSEQRTGCA
jgi:hypothetical protein